MAAELIQELQTLLTAPGPAELGPGARPGTESAAALNARIEALFQAHPRPRRAELIRALLLLWHDHLDASHVISQDESGADGSLVHGLMHRREPDYGNAKYWWRAAGRHPAFPAIAAKVAPLLAADPALARQILPGGNWDPFTFTDAVQAGVRKPAADPRHQLLRAVQQAEFSAVLEHLTA